MVGISPLLHTIHSLISATPLSVTNVHKIPVSVLSGCLSLTMFNEPGQTSIPVLLLNVRFHVPGGADDLLGKSHGALGAHSKF
jgi:hypothetical protein